MWERRGGGKRQSENMSERTEGRQGSGNNGWTLCSYRSFPILMILWFCNQARWIGDSTGVGPWLPEVRSWPWARWKSSKPEVSGELRISLSAVGAKTPAVTLLLNTAWWWGTKDVHSARVTCWSTDTLAAAASPVPRCVPGQVALGARGGWGPLCLLWNQPRCTFLSPRAWLQFEDHANLLSVV